MKRRQVLQFGLASLPLIAFPAITRAQKKLDVKMCLDWAFLSYQAVFTIPVDDGTYQSLGLNVQVDRGNGTVDSISKVAGRAYDFGHADMYAVADFNNRNPDNPIMGVMLTHDKALVAVTAMNTSGIRKPADLAGKTIASPAGDSSRQVFPVFAKANGLDPKSVKWLDVTPDLRESMLVRGRTDAISGQVTTVVPNLLALKVKKDQYTIMPYADYGLNFYGHMLITRPDFAKKNPEAVSNFIRGVAHGFKVAHDNPKAAVASVKKRDPLLEDQLELDRLALASYGFFTENVMEHGLSSPNIERLQKSLGEAAQVFGFKEPAWRTVYNPDYLPDRKYLMIKS